MLDDVIIIWREINAKYYEARKNFFFSIFKRMKKYITRLLNFVVQYLHYVNDSWFYRPVAVDLFMNIFSHNGRFVDYIFHKKILKSKPELRSQRN